MFVAYTSTYIIDNYKPLFVLYTSTYIIDN